MRQSIQRACRAVKVALAGCSNARPRVVHMMTKLRHHTHYLSWRSTYYLQANLVLPVFSTHAAMSITNQSSQLNCCGSSRPDLGSFVKTNGDQYCRSMYLIPASGLQAGVPSFDGSGQPPLCHRSPVHIYSVSPLVVCTGMTKFCWACPAMQSHHHGTT